MNKRQRLQFRSFRLQAPSLPWNGRQIQSMFDQRMINWYFAVVYPREQAKKNER